MGRQKGIIPVKGSVGGLTFYKAYGRDLVRKTYGPDSETIRSGANYQRTRENNTEFGGCSKISTSFRRSLVQVKPLTDGQLGSRLIKLFKFISLNDDGVRGQRPLKLSNHREAFKNLECNINRKFSNAIPAIIQTTRNTERTAASFTLQGGPTINFPKGATHFRLVQSLSLVSDYIFFENINDYKAQHPDLDSREVVKHSDYFSLEIDSFPTTPSAIDLELKEPPPESVTVIHAVGVEYFQMLGSVFYPLKHGQALKIVDLF